MLVACSAALAQYPQRPVKVVVPAAAGGGTDIQARYMAARLSERLGQQFIIENVPAAGGNAAAAQVGRAEPDGYTLLMIAPATVINHSLYARPGYDARKDFAQVAAWAQSPLLFIANPSLAVANLKELADYTKANPGKLAFGSGPGFINHMVMELYKIEASANILFVPYRGQAPALTDVLSGQIALTVEFGRQRRAICRQRQGQGAGDHQRRPFIGIPQCADGRRIRISQADRQHLVRRAGARESSAGHHCQTRRRDRRHPEGSGGRQAHP